MSDIDDERFVEVFRDGQDFDIECGLCGHRQRNVATSEQAAREVADEHEQNCPERG